MFVTLSFTNLPLMILNSFVPRFMSSTRRLQISWFLIPEYASRDIIAFSLIFLQAIINLVTSDSERVSLIILLGSSAFLTWRIPLSSVNVQLPCSCSLCDCNYIFYRASIGYNSWYLYIEVWFSSFSQAMLKPWNTIYCPCPQPSWQRDILQTFYRTFHFSYIHLSP